MNTLKQQFDDMLGRGTIPCFELKIPNDEYLVVDLYVDDEGKGVYFEFDDHDKPVYFDGDIKNLGDVFLAPFDESFESLDYYLEFIYSNITEGFLLPNNMYLQQ